MTFLSIPAARTLQPLAGGEIITRLNIMPADVGDCEIAVGIKRLGPAVKWSSLGGAVQPVQAHAGAQIIVAVIRVELPGSAYQ